MRQERAKYEEERSKTIFDQKSLNELANPTVPSKTDATSIQGHLFKLGDGLYPQWNLRWFVVQNGFIKYYKQGKVRPHFQPFLELISSTRISVQ